ncbi:MAG: hypothetical protein C1943_11715 [Halochromatium sp.]|nr:hypothetical protein [Halochromatium sp.]
MPKLTPLQWLILLILLFFYGFTVFALTRDYYLRHPPQPQRAVQQGPHSLPAAQDQALGQRMRQALGQEDRGPEIDLTSTDPIALGEAADQLFVARRFNEAIPVYQRVLELRPDDAETSNDLGLALHYGGQGQEAIEVLQQGTTAAPGFQRIWLSLGFVALQNNESALAREALDRAQSLEPGTEIADEARRLLGLMDRPAAQP